MDTQRHLEILSGQFGQNDVCRVTLVYQGWGPLATGCDVHGDPLAIGDKRFDIGFGSHSNSRIRVTSTVPLKRFHAVAGIASNSFTRINTEFIRPVDFAVEIRGAVVSQKKQVVFGQLAEFDVPLDGALEFELTADAEFTHASHIVWCEPEVEDQDGNLIRLALNKEPFAGNFPVSFQYGDEDSGTFIRKWGLQVGMRMENDVAVHTYVSQAPELMMKLECRQYRDFPVLEWHLSFSNPSKNKKSKQLTNVRSLNFYCNRKGHEITLTRYRGAFERLEEDYPDSFRSSFLPVEDEAIAGERWQFGATLGRPSTEWLPCVDVCDGSSLWRLVIGWAGQWNGEAAFDGEQLTLNAGIQSFASCLEPGETIEMPSAILQMTDGLTMENAVNLWRRFVQAHIMNENVERRAPLSTMGWGGMPEKHHLKKLELMKREKLPFEVYWIDAGWFAHESPDEHDNTWAKTVGDWAFWPDTFPEEMRNISAECHRQNRKFLLWLEPERARISSEITKVHPDYFVFNGSEDAMLDLGNPDAWEYCRQLLSRIIRDNGMDWLRIDFNFSPLLYWQQKDVPGRKGMAEVLYVMGLYKLWRELKKEFPQLMIDNCASGGRRLDFELLRYSLPLWYSDMQCFADFNPKYALTQMAGLHRFWPVFACGTQNREGGDTYRFRIMMASGLAVPMYYTAAFQSEKYPFDWLRERLQEFLEIRDCFAGDFRILAEPTADERNMTVLQYDLPEQKRGCILVVRGEKCPEITRMLCPRGLKADAVYSVKDRDGQLPPVKISGDVWMKEGICVRMPVPRTALLVTYEYENEMDRH